MKRPTTLVTFVALAAALGCAEEQAPQPAAPCRQAQSLMLNGADLGGAAAWTWNGRSLNGIVLNAWNNGSELQGDALQGVVPGDGAILAVTVSGRELPLTVVGAELGDDGLEYLALTTPDGANVCGADGRGIVVQGVWDLVSGDRHDAMRVGERELRHSFSCTSGVIAKCAMWGYDPAAHGPVVHQSCTRLARADYCGDGIAHTDDGTAIDVYDGIGVLSPAGGMDFEAGWGPDGAVCVAHRRYLDTVVDAGAGHPELLGAAPPLRRRERGTGARGAPFQRLDDGGAHLVQRERRAGLASLIAGMSKLGITLAHRVDCRARLEAAPAVQGAARCAPRTARGIMPRIRSATASVARARPSSSISAHWRPLRALALAEQLAQHAADERAVDHASDVALHARRPLRHSANPR